MVDTSDTPAGRLSRINEAVERRGEPVTITRRGDPPVTVSAKAKLKPIKSETMIGPIRQSWWEVILSPTGLSAVLPLRPGDNVTFQGKEWQIQDYRPYRPGGVLCRIELIVAG